MFRMAARNIKDNTSESVSEEQIKSVLRRSLDEVLLLFSTQGLCMSEKNVKGTIQYTIHEKCYSQNYY